MSQKYCACHTKQLSTRYKTRLHVTKCHACHAKRSNEKFETSKNDNLCRTYHRHGHMVLTRTVADGCGRTRNVERTHPQPAEPQGPEWNGNPCYAFGKKTELFRMKVMTNSKNIDQELMWRLSGGWCTKLIKVTVFKGKIAEVEGAYGEKGEPSDFRHYSACCIILDFSGFFAQFAHHFFYESCLLTQLHVFPSLSLRVPFRFPSVQEEFHSMLKQTPWAISRFLNKLRKEVAAESIHLWTLWSTESGQEWVATTPPKKIIQKIREIAKHTKHMKSIEKPCVSSSLWLRTVAQVNRWVRSHWSYGSRGGDWNACGSEKLEEIP